MGTGQLAVLRVLATVQYYRLQHSSTVILASSVLTATVALRRLYDRSYICTLLASRESRVQCTVQLYCVQDLYRYCLT
jgi:hypothetical protein